MKIPLNFIGLFDDMAFVNSKTIAPHFRKKRTGKVSENTKAALARYNKRTKYLSNLASQLNKVMYRYGGSFKSNKFFQNVWSTFRKEPLDNRFMLLRQLIGTEINSNHPSTKLGTCRTSVEELKNKFLVSISPTNHPGSGKYKANCYYYEVIMVTWNNTDNHPRYSSQLTNWIRLTDRMNDYEFDFPKPANTVNYMLCLRQQLGIKHVPIEKPEAQSMHIADVGTSDKIDLKLLAIRKKDEEQEKEEQRKTKEEQRKMKEQKDKSRVGPKKEIRRKVS